MGKSENKEKRILVNDAFYFTVPENMKYTTRDVSFEKETVLYCISAETENGKKASFKDISNSSTFLFINGSGTTDLNFECMEKSHFKELSDSYYHTLQDSFTNVTKPITLKPDKNTVIYLSSAKVSNICTFPFVLLLDKQGIYFGTIGIYEKDMNTAKAYVKNLLMTISANDDTRDADDFTEIEEKQPVLPKYNQKLLTAKRPNKSTEDLYINVRGDFNIKVPKGMYYSVNEDLIGNHRAFVCISDDKGSVGRIGDVSEPFGYYVNLSVMQSGQYCPSFKSNLPPAYFLSKCSLMKNELNEGIPIKLYKAEKDYRIYCIYGANEIIKQCGFIIFCSCGEIYFGQFFVNDYQMTNAEFNRQLFNWLDSIKIEKMDFDGKKSKPDFSAVKKVEEVFSD